MTHRFTARSVCGLDDPELDDCVLAGLAESDDEGAFSLTFMCDFAEPDAQETALGFDTHCLVTPDQNTAYGCVRRAELDGDVLRIALDPASLPALRLSDPLIEITLTAPAADITRMRTALAHILTYGRPDARPVVENLRDTGHPRTT